MNKSNLLPHLLILIFLVTALFAETEELKTDKPDLQVFTMRDGSEMTGEIIDENDSLVIVNLTTGFKVDIPRTSILTQEAFQGQMVEGEIYQVDPNRSRYLWSVSAFPVGEGEGYCSDFCIVLPSYNFGISDQLSAQIGGMYFPGLTLDTMPFFASLKMSLPTLGSVMTAGGIQYFTIPGLFGDDERFGTGFLFATATLGNKLDHISATLGWGFVDIDGETEVMDRPIIVIAGNKRFSSSFAIVSENWIIPDSNISEIPVSLAIRFLGKKIAVDFGGITTLSMLEDGFVLPMPILNFAYHK